MTSPFRTDPARRANAGILLAIIALVVALDVPGYAASMIDGALIRTKTVAGSKLRDQAVTSGKIRNGAVASAKLGNGAVTASKLGSQAVTRGRIRDGAISQSKIAAGAVTTEALARGAAGGAALDAAGTATVTFTTVAPGTCQNQGIVVPSDQIADGTLSDDVVMATPNSAYAGNFTYSVKVEAGTIAYIKACNVGSANTTPTLPATSTWRWVAIDIG